MFAVYFQIDQLEKKKVGVCMCIETKQIQQNVTASESR